MYLDWIRAIAVIMVVFVHSLVTTFDLLDVHSQREQRNSTKMHWDQLVQWKEGVLRQLLQMGIPLFFYISGISSSAGYSRHDKDYPKSSLIEAFWACGKFVASKFHRLILPLVWVIPIFLMPRHYWG